jgi:hypothetical protein
MVKETKNLKNFELDKIDLPRKRLFATVPTTEQFFLNASFGGN